MRRLDCLSRCPCSPVPDRPSAVTHVPSRDGQFWDIQDTSPWSAGQRRHRHRRPRHPFNGFGYLKVHVRRNDALLVRNRYLTGFGLSPDGGVALRLDPPALVARDRRVARDLTHRQTLTTSATSTASSTPRDDDRIVEVAWGGAAGAYDEGGLAAVAATSSGDRRIDQADSFVTMMQNVRRVDDPMRGPSGHGPPRTCWARGAAC